MGGRIWPVADEPHRRHTVFDAAGNYLFGWTNPDPLAEDGQLLPFVPGQRALRGLLHRRIRALLASDWPPAANLRAVELVLDPPDPGSFLVVADTHSHRGYL